MLGKHPKRKSSLSKLNQLVLDGYRDGVGYEYYHREMSKRKNRRELTPKI